MLVMGPWTHRGCARRDGDRVGNVPFNSKTAQYCRKTIEFPFFPRARSAGILLPRAALPPTVMRMFPVVLEYDLSGTGLTGAPTWASVDSATFTGARIRPSSC